MSSVQYVMADIDINPHATIFYIGNEVAPEGYPLGLPQGQTGGKRWVSGSPAKKSGKGHRAKDYLDKFVKQKFPHGKTIECIVGGVSVCRPLDCTVADGLMLAGDAARVVDPLTGGGIYNAMFTGKLAAETAAACIAKGDTSKKALMAYDKAWRASPMGKTIERNYHIKEYMIKQSDEKMNAIIHSVSKLDLKEFSTLSLVKELLKANPKLLVELGTLAASLR